MAKGESIKAYKLYEIRDGKAILKNKKCPKCRGFMAKAPDRYFCGGCGYTEFIGQEDKKEKKEGAPKEEKKEKEKQEEKK